MRKMLIILSLALLVTGAAAKEPETLEQLKARTEATTGARKALLYAEVVQREIEIANQLFTGGEAEKAHALVREAVGYAEKARDSVREHPRRIKDTEIALRKAEHRLNDIRRTLALEDQPDVQAAVDQIAAIRKQLLDLLFAPRHQR
ncbi:MAG: hypothetical protein LAN37_05875 [Acidobacteriia bacterium]|nr:hypothetical protein [Terriglobia bacterium]